MSNIFVKNTYWQFVRRRFFMIDQTWPALIQNRFHLFYSPALSEAAYWWLHLEYYCWIYCSKLNDTSIMSGILSIFLSSSSLCCIHLAKLAYHHHNFNFAAARNRSFDIIPYHCCIFLKARRSEYLMFV